MYICRCRAISNYIADVYYDAYQELIVLRELLPAYWVGTAGHWAGDEAENVFPFLSELEMSLIVVYPVRRQGASFNSEFSSRFYLTVNSDAAMR